MPLTLVRNDITQMDVDAIVNAANTQLAQGGGVCGAIFAAAGAEQMQQACASLAPIRTGEAVITPGFALPARHVIHTAGPVYSQHSPEQAEQLLRNAYTHSLQLAVEQGCQSIAFPLLSAGIYGYPKDQALSVACDAIGRFLQQQEAEPDVYLVVFDKNAFALSQDLQGEVASFVDQHYVDESYRRHGRHRLARLNEADRAFFDQEDGFYESVEEVHYKPGFAGELELEEPFEAYLLRLIRERDMSEVEVYKNANLSRKLFSKIRTGKGYVPSKRTVLALAIGMRLNLQQTSELLQRAGYALTRNQKLDVIIEYFIGKRRYDIFEINAVLFQYEQALLGS